MKVSVDIEEYRNRVERIARDMILLMVKDIKKANNPRNKKSALEWFNRRDTSPFGYGWCLKYTKINPNMIRRYINKRSSI